MLTHRLLLYGKIIYNLLRILIKEWSRRTPALYFTDFLTSRCSSPPRGWRLRLHFDARGLKGKVKIINVGSIEGLAGGLGGGRVGVRCWFLDECTAKRNNEFIQSDAAMEKTSMGSLPMKMLMERLSLSPSHNILLSRSHTRITTLKLISSRLSLR